MQVKVKLRLLLALGVCFAVGTCYCSSIIVLYLFGLFSSKLCCCGSLIGLIVYIFLRTSRLETEHSHWRLPCLRTLSVKLRKPLNSSFVTQYMPKLEKYFLNYFCLVGF